MIDLNRSAEQTQIVDSARAMLAATYPVTRLREARLAHDDLTALREFGAFGVSVPETAGGWGLSAVEDYLLHREFGRHLVSPSSIAAPLAMRIAMETGQHELSAMLAKGQGNVCLGNLVENPAQPGGNGTAPQNHEVHLYDAAGCDRAVVLSRDGVALIDIEAGRSVEIESACKHVTLSRYGARSALQFRSGDVSEAARLGKLLIAAQLLGICEAARDLSTEYAKVRTQFGQPIGSFQAIKHRCANMAIASEVLSAILDFAALAARDGWTDASAQIDSAMLLACRYAIDICRSSIQVHGGIGFSAECDAHLYLLHAQLFENLGGTAADRQASVLADRFWPAVDAA